LTDERINELNSLLAEYPYSQSAKPSPKVRKNQTSLRRDTRVTSIQQIPKLLGICCLIKSQFSLGAAKPRQVKTGILLGFYFMASPLVSSTDGDRPISSGIPKG
jgi:hypothetical protein